MIHGLPNEKGWIGAKHTSVDWTDGCIAVTNREIEWLYRAVADGTPVEIRA
jgi:lipoprotein-anchoring transpeptidase ErfK/SrfK